MGEAADLIKKIANSDDVRMLSCTVDSVDGSTCDVTPVSGDAPLKKVRLNADITSDLGNLIVPKIGSVVLVAQLTEVDSFVAMFSEIESISLKIQGKVSIKASSSGNVVIDVEGNLDISAAAIFLGGSNGIVTAPGLPPGSPIADVSQLVVATKVKGS